MYVHCPVLSWTIHLTECMDGMMWTQGAMEGVTTCLLHGKKINLVVAKICLWVKMGLLISYFWCGSCSTSHSHLNHMVLFQF